MGLTEMIWMVALMASSSQSITPISEQRTCLFKLEPWRPRKELGVVAIAEIAKKIRFHVPGRKKLLLTSFAFSAAAEELLVEFRIIESRHWTAVEPQRSRGNDQICSLQRGIAFRSDFD